MFQTKHKEHPLRKYFCLWNFSINHKENELHRKYKVFEGSMENAKAPLILEIEQNVWFHWI